MKTYRLLVGSEYALAFQGESLVSAVEDNFTHIAKALHVGNVAGYYLLSAKMAYDPSIFDGEGGAVLTVVAQGSDSLVGYDESKDPPKTYAAQINGVTPDELPATHNFEIDPERTFDPITDDLTMYDNGFRLGVVWAMIDRIADRYAQINVKNADMFTSRYPEQKNANPVAFTHKMLADLSGLRPKKSAAADKLMARIHGILATIDGPINLNYGWMGYHKTGAYFTRIPQRSHITTLRTARGKTQAQLAQEAGISLRQYQRIEGGKTEIGSVSYDTVIALAKAFGERPEQLKTAHAAD